ncbi:MAG: lysylphosphatidylglycerol synthase transmembrane domain-containing protein, partial [Spirochaetales bacterium]
MSSSVQKRQTPKAQNQCEDATSPKSDDKASSRKMIKSVFLALLVGILINVFIGLLVDFGELVNTIKSVSLMTATLPFAIILIIYVIDSLRYQLVFKRFNIKVSFRDSLYNNVIGYFFSNITPGSV